MAAREPLIKQIRTEFARGDLVRAEQHCREALNLDKQNFELLSLAGTIAARRSDYDEARHFFRRALKVRPADAAAHYDLGRCSIVLGRHYDAIASLKRAIALEPRHADAHAHLAVALKAVGALLEGDALFEKSLYLKRDHLLRHPGDARGWRELATAYGEMGDASMAISCCRQVLAIDPQSVWARGAEVMYSLPSVYGDGDDPHEVRSAFSTALAGLDEWLAQTRPRNSFAAFDRCRVFYLAYQDEDNLALLSRYGDCCSRAMHLWLAEQHVVRRSPPAGRKIHVGIVVANFRRDSVQDVIYGPWLRRLDRDAFQLLLFHLGTRSDREDASNFADIKSVDLSSLALEDVVGGIAASTPDVLVYPAVGMNPKVCVLASFRLAPVQIASWGHPETTGLPTIDYFLSAQALEPSDAQQHYRERLVLLPRLGCCYARSNVVAAEPGLARLGIDEDRPIIVCPGTPFKYAPEHDDVLVELARRLQKCQLVFFQYERPFLTRTLQRRLQVVFARSGLTLEHYAVFVPWMNRSQYYGLLHRATVQLDTIGFSGFNTVMHSIECGLPIVTHEGRFLRGRLASGVLRQMDLHELVAISKAEYIDLVARVAEDPVFRQRIRDRIESARDALFDDVSAVRAFEEFLHSAIAGSALPAD